MSHRVQKKVQVAAFCNTCKIAGQPSGIYNGHNTRDVKGRICCPTILMNMCTKCDCKGHFPKYCPGKKTVAATIEKKTVSLAAHKKDEVAKSVNPFALLEDIDEDDAPPPNVTIRQKVSMKNRSWADYSDDEED